MERKPSAPEADPEVEAEPEAEVETVSLALYPEPGQSLTARTRVEPPRTLPCPNDLAKPSPSSPSASDAHEALYAAAASALRLFCLGSPKAEQASATVSPTPRDGSSLSLVLSALQMAERGMAVAEDESMEGGLL